MDSLTERLRAEEFSGQFTLGGGTIDANGNGTSWGGERIMRLINPDGPAAAKRIEALEAEIAALKASLSARTGSENPHG